MATLLKKISAKNIVNDLKAVARSVEKDGGVKEIYKILGIVTSLKTGESQYGQYVEFNGNFFATNCVTGEQFESGKCFLPDPLPGMIQSALANNDSVEFALSVSIKRRDDLAIGYEYLVSPLVETRSADPLAHLKQAVLGALPAPVAEEAEEAPKAKKGKAA
jgi:hypothetical protein